MVVIFEPLALHTRRRRQIRNVQRLEQPPDRLRAAARQVTQAHASAQLRSATGVYNCFGLVFASRRTWVERLDDGDTEQEVMNILSDDRYERLPEGVTPEIGDVVLYRNLQGELTHAGIVAGVPPYPMAVRVMSQWGIAGEYHHDAADVETALGQPVEFWTDRKRA